MKMILSAALAIATLSACSLGTPGMSIGLGLGTALGNHVGLGTSLNIPVRLDKTKIGSNTNQTKNSSVNIVDEQIVTYFDAHGNVSNNAVNGGFYRQLLSKRNNEYVVQDFYGDNNIKRTDPYTISRNQLMQFHATPTNGSLTTYAYNGNIMQQQVFQNGKLVSAKY
ncbi:NemA protein [Neisseria iguanae]|uniref:NemA protein n=1 Tax=Neisseria iguanae TaxID=90242 RepID=A0A2P7U0I9_9NEIS|nr:NemA protein [Neisseria iguanae]PSJ80455.1 NemA protein [Neisseria iguanae]